MAEAKLGSLGVRVVLDRGSRPHYGPDDLVAGKVVLLYKPYTSLFKSNVTTADLFGPLKLEVTLRGKVKIIVKRDREFGTDCGMPLFKETFEIFNGSFKAEVGQKYEFPFAINFPTLVNELPLPPSFTVYFSDYPDKVDAAIVYRIGCKANMTGIDVKTTNIDFNAEPMVRLDFPRPPPDLFAIPLSTFEYKSVLQHSNLLPESERPIGFRAKAKAAFSTNNFPKFVCRLSCTQLKHIYPGLRPEFIITLRRSDVETTATFFPDVNVVSVRADLIADTVVDTSGRLLASSTCADRATVQKLDWREVTGSTISLSKASDYSATIQLGPFHGHVSTFSHPKATRSYFLRTTIKLKIAEQTVEFNKLYSVLMVPPPLNSVQYECEDAAEAGPSRIEREEDENVQLPAYHEIEAGPPQMTKEGE